MSEQQKIPACAIVGGVMALIGFLSAPLVVGFLFAIPAVICGHMALTKIRRSEDTLGGLSLTIATLAGGYMAMLISLGMVLLLVLPLTLKWLESRPPEATREAAAKLQEQGPEAVCTGTTKLLSEGRQSEAEDVLDLGLKKFPDNPRMHFMRGVLHRSRWGKDAAYEHFAYVINSDPDMSESQAAQCVIAIDSGEYIQRNMAKLQELSEAHPDDPYLLWLIAICCREYGKRTRDITYAELGVSCFAKLLEQWSPGPVLVHQSYANILSDELKRYEEALPSRRIAVKLAPTAWTYQGLGNTLSGLGRYEEANEAFAKCVEYAPKNNDYWISWGNNLSDAKQYEQAEQKYERALKLNPYAHKAWSGWAYVLRQQGKYDEAFEKFDAAASLGSTYALFAIGSMHECGEGVEQDYEKAFEWYLKAAEQGNTLGMANVGRLFREGKGTEARRAHALKWLRQGVERGNSDCMFSLGWSYYSTSPGTPTDWREALKWFEKAYEHGLPKGGFFVARIYEHGRFGVKKSEARAFEWYQKAAEKGHADAMLELARYYSRQHGSEDADRNACEWLQKAVERDQVEAMNLLAARHATGRGVTRDPKKALALYQRAHEGGHKSAIQSIARMYRGEELLRENLEEAIFWQIKTVAEMSPVHDRDFIYTFIEKVRAEDPETVALAEERIEKEGLSLDSLHRSRRSPPADLLKKAEGGDACAQVQIAQLYWHGERASESNIIRLDPDEAMKWAMKAADQGNSQGQFVVGYIYQMTSEPKKAMQWIEKAAENGYPRAQFRIGMAYATGRDGVAKDMTKALYWLEKAADQDEEDAYRYLVWHYSRQRNAEKEREWQAKAYEFRKRQAAGKKNAPVGPLR